MTRAERRGIIEAAVLCGFGGPIVGAVVLQQLYFWFAGRWPGFGRELEGVPSTSVFFSFFYFSLIVTGPAAALLGAFAAWLLVIARRRGVRRRALYLNGALIGGALGALCPLIAIFVFAALFAVFTLTPRLGINAEVLSWADPRNPFVVTGLITGVILGLITALRITQDIAVDAT